MATGFLAATAYRLSHRSTAHGEPPPFRLTLRNGMAETGVPSISLTIENLGIRTSVLVSAGLKFRIDPGLRSTDLPVPAVSLLGPGDAHRPLEPGRSIVLSHTFKSEPLPWPADTPVIAWADVRPSYIVFTEPTNLFASWGIEAPATQHRGTDGQASTA